jgi:hypothetical protein
MLIENSVGEEIKTYCLLDSDYHTPEEIAGRLKDARMKHVELHIWHKKEIENYLLVPSLIRRVIGRGRDKPPSETEIGQFLSELAATLRDSVQDSFAESFLAQDRAKGATTANQRAREVVTKAWEDGEALSRICGKSALSALSDWSKRSFGVSFGISTLLGEMRRSEIDDEVVEVLSAIEDLTEISNS